MIPFRVYDREKREMWLVLNYHGQAGDGGTYLLAREDEGENDGEMKLIKTNELAKFRLVDFLDLEEGVSE